jgi:hypothetical protein
VAKGSHGEEAEVESRALTWRRKHQADQEQTNTRLNRELKRLLKTCSGNEETQSQKQKRIWDATTKAEMIKRGMSEAATQRRTTERKKGMGKHDAAEARECQRGTHNMKRKQGDRNSREENLQRLLVHRV